MGTMAEDPQKQQSELQPQHGETTFQGTGVSNDMYKAMVQELLDHHNSQLKLALFPFSFSRCKQTPKTKNCVL